MLKSAYFWLLGVHLGSHRSPLRSGTSPNMIFGMSFDSLMPSTRKINGSKKSQSLGSDIKCHITLKVQQCTLHFRKPPVFISLDKEGQEHIYSFSSWYAILKRVYPKVNTICLFLKKMSIVINERKNSLFVHFSAHAYCYILSNDHFISTSINDVAKDVPFGLTLFYMGSGMTLLHGGGPLWPRFSFNLIALWNGLKWPEICFHIKIQVFSFPYTPKKDL